MRAAFASILKTDAEIDDAAGDWPVKRARKWGGNRSGPNPKVLMDTYAMAAWRRCLAAQELQGADALNPSR